MSVIGTFGYKSPRGISEKFINFECLFPASDAVLKQLFRKKLDSVLREYSCTDSKDLIISSILEIDNIIDAFETPRDIVRFLNIFTFAMDCIERNEIMAEINVADLFAISLIKYLEIMMVCFYHTMTRQNR